MKAQTENELKSSHAGHQKRSREFHDRPENKVRRDPDPVEFCVCPTCRKRVMHPRGTLCSIMRCPDCGAHMIRDWP